MQVLKQDFFREFTGKKVIKSVQDRVRKLQDICKKQKNKTLQLKTLLVPILGSEPHLMLEVEFSCFKEIAVMHSNFNQLVISHG